MRGDQRASTNGLLQAVLEARLWKDAIPPFDQAVGAEDAETGSDRDLQRAGERPERVAEAARFAGAAVGRGPEEKPRHRSEYRAARRIAGASRRQHPPALPHVGP